MEGSYAIKKIVIFLILFFFIGCREQTTNTSVQLFLHDSFENGDIICRLGNGYFSNIFKNFSNEEKKYSHIGIIEKNNDSVYVIHCEASEFSGIGFVKREKINVFLDKINTWAVFRFSVHDSIQKKIVQNALIYYEKKTPFDLNFDLTNDNEVYCTELVALCINKSFNYNIIKPNLILNNKYFYGIDNIYHNPKMNLIINHD